MSHFDLMMNLMCEEATKCTEVSEIAAAAAAAAAHCTLHTHTHRCNKSMLFNSSFEDSLVMISRVLLPALITKSSTAIKISAVAPVLLLLLILSSSQLSP